MKWAYRQTKPGIIFGMVALLAFELAVVFSVSPVHALNVTVNSTQGNSCVNCGTLAAAAFTPTIGDAIIIPVAITDGALHTSFGPNVATVTDSQGNTYVHQFGIALVGGASTCAAGECVDAEIWSARASTAAADTVTVTISQFGTATQWVFTAMDVTGVDPFTGNSDTGSCATVGACTTATTAQTDNGNTFGFASINVAAFACAAGGCYVGPGAGYNSMNVLNGAGGTQYSLTVSPPTKYPVSKVNSAVSFYALVGSTFSSTQPIGSTTTINGNCLGACSGPQNGTASFLLTNAYYFYQSQAQASPGLIDNFTAKISIFSVNMPPSTKLYVVTYSTGNSNPPSGTNQYNLIKANVVPVANNTRNRFLHVNPEAPICASCFYAVGIYVNSTHSNSGAITGSGLSLFETSQIGITEYKNTGIATIPNIFFSNTQKTPRDFMYIHSTFSVATFTSTSTTTVSGTVSVTTTVTSTTLDESIAINSMTNYALALLLILGPGLLLGGAIGIWTKSFPGVAVGLIVGILIGTGLGVQANLVTTGFEALAAITVVFLGVMAFVSSRGGG